MESFCNLKNCTDVPLGLLSKEAAKKGVGIIGPATVGGMMPGRFRIGNAGGAVELLGMIQKLDVLDTPPVN